MGPGGNQVGPGHGRPAPPDHKAKFRDSRGMPVTRGLRTRSHTLHTDTLCTLNTRIVGFTLRWDQGPNYVGDKYLLL